MATWKEVIARQEAEIRVAKDSIEWRDGLKAILESESTESKEEAEA